ncbi:hypothetical protein ACH41E_33440 [Streptomyces sp. NPDC020412]|uniref:hypothetical protein n=1 Tax=Streptomyces sp. NPDC020412 TaxID=3365073 RepID=UPI0037A2C2FC
MMSQIWRWPLHSPRRLLGTLLLLVLVLVVVTMAPTLWSASGRPSASPARTTDDRPAPAPTPSPSSSTAGPSPSESEDYGQALDVARQFVSAWAGNKSSFQVWYAGVAVHATDDFAQRLATVDPKNITARGVIGKLRLTDTGGGGRTEVAVLTDDGLVSVTMLRDRDHRWLVSDLQPGAQQEAG